MAPGTLIYGVFAHEGINVIRCLLDGTFLDQNNDWVEAWEAEYEDRMNPLSPELAASLAKYGSEGAYLWIEGGPMDEARMADVRDPYSWIPLVDPPWERGWGPVSIAAEVGSDEMWSGERFRRVADYNESQLIAMAAGLGLAIVRDDQLVADESERVFQPCGCGREGAPKVILTNADAMSGWYRDGYLVGRSLIMCPSQYNTGSEELESWADTLMIDLSDPQELYDLFAGDDPFEEDPETFAGILRGTGEPDLAVIADELDRLVEERSH